MKSKGRILLGYILILIGLAIPLYASTRIILGQSQNSKAYEAYRDLAGQRDQAYYDARDQMAQAYKEDLSQGQPLDPWQDKDQEEVKSFFDEEDQDAFAYISIPALDQTRPIYLGASEENLRWGFAVVEGTDLPLGGPGTRSVIAGHRSTIIDVTLLHADKLQKGDLLYIDLGDKILTYQMVESRLIDPEEWQEVLPQEGKDLISLLTCDPVYPPFVNRLIVDFERVEEKEVKADGKTYVKMPGPQPQDLLESQPSLDQVKTEEKVIKYANIGLWLIFILVIIRMIGAMRAR